MIIAQLLALLLVTLTGPEGQHIELNPNVIVTIREPRGDTHFHKEIKCVIHTSDGKFLSVQETCARVHELIDEALERD
jgi:hypothetical protein